MTFSLSKKLLLSSLFLLLSCTQAKLVVKYPTELNTKIDVENGIDYTVLTPQNKITYKKAFIGILTLADPANACDHIDSISTLQDQIYNPILLVEWGDCHYAQKVKNAENAGAKMVLIILRHDMQLNHPAVRPLQINTNIEVLAISQSHGKILSDYIKENKIAGKDASVELTYSYEVERHVNYRKDDNVLIDFWFSSGDVSQASYDFLSTLGEVIKEFGRSINFNPHYMMWECDSEGDSCKTNPRCIADGKYCDPEPLIEGKIPGKEAVSENLRQICFRELNSRTDVDNAWWKYVTGFGDHCVELDVKEIGACRDQLTNQFDDKITDAVEKCMKNSFETQGMNSGRNEHLSRELNQKEEMHVDHYPALYVNKERYQGSFRNKYMLKEFICSHFLQEKQPNTCAVAASSTATEETASSSEIGVYVVLILVSILLMALMIYCVRRSVKRQVMFRMNDEISHIVTQYKQFKDKSNSFSIDDEN